MSWMEGSDSGGYSELHKDATHISYVWLELILVSSVDSRMSILAPSFLPLVPWNLPCFHTTALT